MLAAEPEVSEESGESGVPSAEPEVSEVPEVSDMPSAEPEISEVPEVSGVPSVETEVSAVPLPPVIRLVRSLIFCSILVFSVPSKGVGW